MLITFNCHFSVFGQEEYGSVKGHIKDAVSKEDVIGANFIILGTTTGVATDVFGKYELRLKSGTYDFQVTAIGYENFTIQELTIQPGEVVTLDIQMVEDQVQLQEIVVTAKADKSNTNILLLERKKSVLAVESIGANELSIKGISNVESGITKLSGITKSSNGIFIRGLGDRYNNVYLNSLPLPSANPDKKVIELDILPTAIVRNIAVSKLYSVNQFADVSGASIDVFTKDFIEEDFLSLNFGIGYNSRTTFKNFNHNQDSNLDYLGFSGNGRRSPLPVDGTDFALRFPSESTDPFNTNFDRETVSAPLDNSWGIQYGKVLKFSKSTLDILFSASYKNSYRNDLGTNDVLNATQDQSTSFLRERDQFQTNLTGLLGLRYDFDKKHQINFNYLFVNNSENNYITSQGRTIDFENIRRLRSRYLEKRLSAIQLNVKNTLIEDRLSLKWGGSIAFAFTDEPDRRDLTFFSPAGQSFGTINRNIAAENGRYFQEIDEQENNLFTELTYSFGDLFKTGNDQKNQFSIGYQFKEKLRSIDFRTFTLITDGLDTENIDLNNLDETFSDQNFQAGSFSYRDINGGERQSRTLRSIHAVYGYFILNPIENLEVVPGIRIEATDQDVFFKLLGNPLGGNFQSVSLNEVNALPSLNAKYTINEKNFFRLGLSRTLTRPNFNELIPAPQVNENLQSIVGRPTLQNSSITNLDLRYELFPNSGELLSFGAFYKHIDKPIEQVRSGENFISFFNVASANVYGVEVEFQKRLHRLANSSFLGGLSLDGNISLLYTDVNINPDEIEDLETRNLLTNVTNTSRTLQGASPYLINLSVGYDNPLFESSTSSSIKLGYNLFGKRIYNVGTQQRGDEFELPVATLDLVVQNRFQNGLGVGLSIKNILNPSIRRQQEAGPQVTLDAITQSFRRGVNYGLNVSYLFNRK